jgi:hypothetical protein
MINMDVTDKEVEEIMKSKKKTLDNLAVLDDMKSLTGLTNDDVQQFN